MDLPLNQNGTHVHMLRMHWKTCKECELLCEGNFCGHKQKWKVHYTRGYQPCPRMIPNSTHHNHCIIIQHNPTTSCQRSLPKKTYSNPVNQAVMWKTLVWKFRNAVMDTVFWALSLFYHSESSVLWLKIGLLHEINVWLVRLSPVINYFIHLLA